MVFKQNIYRIVGRELPDGQPVGRLDGGMPLAGGITVVDSVNFIRKRTVQVHQQRSGAGAEEGGPARMIAPPGWIGIGHEEQSELVGLPQEIREISRRAKRRVGRQVIGIFLVETAHEIIREVNQRR